jgi:hypothetical protein
LRVSLFAVLGLPLLLSGCSLSPTALLSAAAIGLTIRGNVHGGQQPINGAHVYLLAAGTSGYGSASTSLLTSGTDGSDSIGGYVLTAPDGSFSVGGTYTCTPNTQVYLFALGGDPGGGANSAVGLLAALGNCPAAGNFATSVPFVSINEVTTVAAAYAFSAFATDATHIGSSGTTVALAGIANAFANASNLVDIPTGSALATTPAGNGTVPQAEINTLANILAACVNSNGSSSATCTTLFSNAMSAGTTGTLASDTATATINIAHNPVAAVAALYAIIPPTPPFAPALGTQPSDFTLILTFTGGGITCANHLAIDSTGSVWTSNSTALAKLSPLGAALSPSTGFTDASLNGAAGLAIDATDNVWATNSNAYTLSEFSAVGQFLNTATAPLNSLYSPHTAAIDPSGNIWVPTYNGLINNVVEFAPNGSYTTTVLSGLLSQPQSIAIDHTGNLWIGNIASSSILKISNLGIPNLLPYSGGGINNPLSIALDSSGDIWALNPDSSLGAINDLGSPYWDAPYATGSSNTGQAFAIDGQNNMWFLSGSTSGFPATFNARLYAVNSGGASLTNGSGFAPLPNATDLAIDSAGNVWIAANTTIAEVIGVAAPITTPIAAAVKNNTIATRP